MAFGGLALGIGLIIFGVVGLVRSIDLDTTPTTAVSFVTTTTTTPSPTTTAVAVSSTTPAATFDPGEFVLLADDSGTFSVAMPAGWPDVAGSEWSVGGEIVGLSVSASTDRAAWYEGWGTEGAFVGVTTVEPEQFSPELGDFSAACTLGSTGNHEYPGFTAIIQEWSDCGDEGSSFRVALVWPTSFEYSALIQLVTIDRDGSSTLNHLITTLSYRS